MPALSSRRLRPARVLPGFGLTLGYTLTCLGLVVLLPLAALLARAAGIGPSGFWAIAHDARVVSALRVSFGLAFVAAVIATIFGTLVAWALTRYDFPGRRLADALVDLPFALPTAVAGIALTALYAPDGFLGAPLKAFGIDVAYTPLGILIAMIFIGVPFTVRTVQPLIADLDAEIEEASATLAAGRATTLIRIVLPTLLPAILTGFALAFARGVGEYGSIIFIAGNVPFVTEIAPLLIVIKLSEFDYAGACAVATIMLVIAFAMLFAINALGAWSRRRIGDV